MLSGSATSNLPSSRVGVARAMSDITINLISSRTHTYQRAAPPRSEESPGHAPLTASTRPGHAKRPRPKTMCAGPVMTASLPHSAHWKPLNSRGCSPNTSGFSCTVVDIAVTKWPVRAASAAAP